MEKKEVIVTVLNREETSFKYTRETVLLSA